MCTAHLWATKEPRCLVSLQNPKIKKRREENEKWMRMGFKGRISAKDPPLLSSPIRLTLVGVDYPGPGLPLSYFLFLSLSLYSNFIWPCKSQVRREEFSVFFSLLKIKRVLSEQEGERVSRGRTQDNAAQRRSL